ncbi:hypothetical protein GSI_01556 [Ganoderma sinense ZZ0214-1]|uniref:Uncharacterized protein n=1 Tax=Ganoderma sinense ZZ0214-1 TaxID=1077348 RepID=A0A2G8SQ54_9APHY|nr:hypothetical protein GSI_01556 [Ganoderma sinense ZZ0214-1]
MAHPPGSTILANANNIVILPLYSLTMVYVNITLRFAPWEYDPETDEERKICCMKVDIAGFPAYLESLLPKVPILFEVIGQISPYDCFLTADGYQSPESSGQEDERLATCWIEAPHDYISRIYWMGIDPAIQEITGFIPGDVNTDKLLGEEDREVILQVCYQPPAGQSITSALPFYNSHGQREVLSSMAEVPFGQPMRIAFALESCFRRGEADGQPILIAVLEHMVIL